MGLRLLEVIKYLFHGQRDMEQHTLDPMQGRWKPTPCETVGLMSIRRWTGGRRTGLLTGLQLIPPPLGRHGVVGFDSWGLGLKQAEAPILTL